jgi:O-antigen/teichoic acid export membrane protein
MLAEYIVKIVTTLIVTIYVARYLGPLEFGKITYAVAVATIFMTLSRLGMESILVRDIAQASQNKMEYMGTAFWLMAVASVIFAGATGFIAWFLESDSPTKIYLMLMAISILAQPLLVIDYYFQGTLRAKYSSSAKSIAIVLSSVFKVLLVILEFPPIYIALAFAAEYLAIGFMLILIYVYTNRFNFIVYAKTSLVHPLLKSAWPMVLAALASTLYARIDQLMIKEMLGSHELGVYAAATKIYEGWVIIPFALSMSLMPAIVAIRSSSKLEYERFMKILFSVLFWMGVSAAVVASMFGREIIIFSFGVEFQQAYAAFAISMWAAAFTALGSVSARYLIVEGWERKILVRTMLGVAINVSLNYFLIPIYGIEGAAYSTLITIVTINYFVNYLDADLKQLVLICNGGIMLGPLRDYLKER